ncbi:MAG: hypothetical protein CMO16_01945 [Thaumarchaeota archaeon]|nr:hypothetical protein [Nitrososphaerota archaeon]|tara:strand:+ start:6845 stop:7384 length:540 start_codon:yes stop_codon:yes gene_type:complete
MAESSYIGDVRLSSSATRIKPGEPLELDLWFKVDGYIRKALNQQNWTDAYNKHDTTFLIKYVVRVQTGSVKKRDVLEPVKFIRKASFYWSRNPKLPPPPPNKKIWALIVVDDSPKFPDNAEEVKSLLLDVRYSVELMGSNIHKGAQKLVAHISVSWGKHLFTEPVEIEATSNEIEIVCE